MLLPLVAVLTIWMQDGLLRCKHPRAESHQHYCASYDPVVERKPRGGLAEGERVGVVVVEFDPDIIDALVRLIEDLRKPSYTRLDAVHALAVIGDAAVETCEKGWPFGTGPDEGHLPAQDVDQLRQLVQARSPQKPADPGDPWIALGCPDGPRAGFGIGSHRAELDDVEQPGAVRAALANAELQEENRTPACRSL